MPNPSTSFLAFNPNPQRIVSISSPIFATPQNVVNANVFCVVPSKPLSTDMYLTDTTDCSINSYTLWVNALVL